MSNNIYFAAEFKDRDELEATVKREFGLDTELKSAEIKGTVADLKKLRLSDKMIFWGIECVATDIKPELSPPNERPNRGEVKKFGININNNDENKN